MTDPMPTITSILYPHSIPAPTHKVRVWSENGMTYAQCGACKYGQESVGADESSRSHVTWYAQMHEGAEL
jgi:hypothetical protein